MEFKNRKTTTPDALANVIVSFLNYAFFDAEYTISKFEEITIETGISYLSQTKANKKTKEVYANKLTKFYFHCFQQGLLPKLTEDTFIITTNYNNKEYIKNIFYGKYEVVYEEKPEVIHSIDTKYIPMFFHTAADVAPDIFLGIFIQFMGGLRCSEVISLEYSNIRHKIQNNITTLSVSLKDKDLRPDLPNAYIAKVKSPGTQTIIPAFGNLLEELYQEHKEKYKSDKHDAIFVDKNGNPMTASTYAKRFNKVKKEFIRRLAELDDIEANSYAVYLSAYKWSTHIGRGVFSNLVAETSRNISEIAVWRRDSSLQSALSYLNDNKTVENKILNIMDNLYTGAYKDEGN